MKLITFLLFFALSTRVGAEPRGNKGTTILVFVDTTGSLSTVQFKRVSELFRTLVVSTPGQLSIEAYAISRNAGADEPVFSGQGMADLMNIAAVVSTQATLDLALEALKSRYQKHQKGGNEPQTCILNSVEFLCQRIVTLRATAKVTAKHIYVVYLSDMLEDCAATPVGQRITMTKSDTTFDQKEALLVKILEQPQCLKNTRLFAILPGEINEDAYPSLTSFWKTAFKRFGMAKADAQDFKLWRNQLPLELAPIRR